jgi:LEA14-like dessication related protein
MNKATVIYIYFIFILIITGCAQLKQKAETLKPTVKIVNTRFVDINFDKADLVFDMIVDNPNPVALKLSGLVYEMIIEGQSLVSGEAARGLKLKPGGKSRIGIPVTLKFDDLKKLPGKLRDKDNIAYRLNTIITVNLPVIGNYDIHLSESGEIPVPKLPDIRLKDVKINKLTLTSAELLTSIEINNPNAFALGLDNFNYKLDINNQTWGKGRIAQKQNVPGKGTGVIKIPVKLNLLNMGRTVYQLLNSEGAFAYQLSGDLNLDAGIALFKKYHMPLDIKGRAFVK